MKDFFAKLKEFFRLRALDKFVLGELTGPFFFGIMVFTTILVAGGLLFRLAELIIERGVSFGVVIRLFLYSLPGIVALTIPMSCLLASLIGFSTMSANSELVALKSAGLSFNRIIKSVMLVSVIVSLLAMFFNETLVPVSEKASGNVMMYEVLKQSPVMFKEKIFLKQEENGELKRVIYVNKMAVGSGEMEKVLVQEYEKGSLARLTDAEKGEWKDGSWWIYNGRVYEIQDNVKASQLFRFDKQQLNLNLTPDEFRRSSDDPDQMGIGDLYKLIKTKYKMGEDPTKLWVALHFRIAIPWACIVLALVGAALGSRPQRTNSSRGVGLSVIIVFVYYVIMSFARSMGEAGLIPSLLSAWLANIVFLVLGVQLCKRANKLG
ncbi:MAG: LptF/LptG family permease [Synergistaceae bacterium]|nr:LptF/LptG family permease [Candidatus Equadaptatus faecalis]